MNTNYLGFILALLLASCAGVDAAEFYTPPVVSVPRVAQAPAIDGHVDLEEWRGAAVLSDFITLGGEDRPKLPTTVYLAYDAKALYVGAQLFDPHPDELRTEVHERDGEVWRDDCLELFIDTVGNGKSYAHLAANSLGTKLDAFNRIVSEDFQWHVATALNENSWSVEISLPFANQVTPQPGDEWIIDVARNAVGVDEQSSWARHNKSFHEPENFGTLIFGGRPFRVTIDDPGRLWLGENTAWISVTPPGITATRTPAEAKPSPPILSTSPWDIKLNVRVMGRDKPGHYFGSVKQTLTSGVTQMAVPYSVKQDGPSTVTFSLTDHEGVVRWRSGPYPVAVPPVSKTLAEVEQTLGQALLAWVRLPDGALKQAAQQQLEELLQGWRYLGKRQLRRDQMTRAELHSLLLQAKSITAQTENLVADMASGSE